VVRAIQEAVGGASIPNLSAYAARQIKPYLQEVVHEIRERVAAAPARTRYNEIVNQVVAGARSIAVSSTRNSLSAGASRRRETDISNIERDKLFAALGYIANLPPPSGDLISALKREPRELQTLRTAIGWLLSLAKCADLPVTTSQSVRDGCTVLAPESNKPAHNHSFDAQ
jgi:hypothetical protein